MQPNCPVFPRDAYEAFVLSIFPLGTTVFWKGAPEPFFAPVAEFQTPIVVKLDVGDAKGYGTNERRRVWDDTANGGQGAYLYYNLQRMKWPLTIDVETFNSNHPGEDFLMAARNKLRWASSIRKIQGMGITTAHVGDVDSEIRATDDHETFGAVLNISHGQCYWLQETDDPGNVIETVGVVQGVITGGNPDPVIAPAPVAWAANVAYFEGSVVSYSGVDYICLAAHTSASGATPDITSALWTVLS